MTKSFRGALLASAALASPAAAQPLPPLVAGSLPSPGVQVSANSPGNTAVPLAFLNKQVATLTKRFAADEVTITMLNTARIADEATIAAQAQSIAALQTAFGNVASMVMATGGVTFTGAGISGTIPFPSSSGSVNTPPTISALAPLTGMDNAPFAPFPGVTVADTDASPSISISIKIKMSGALTDANGTLSGATKAGTGTYTIAGASPAAITTALQAVMFTPTLHQVAAGSTVQTNFILAAAEGTGITTANTSAVVTATAAGGRSGSTRGAPLNLTTDAATAATMNGSSFSWVNRMGSTVSGGGTSPLMFTQPFHANTTNGTGLTAQLASGPACYAALVTNQDGDYTYNSGMFLQAGRAGAVTLLQNIYANNAQSNFRVVNETNFQGAGANILSSGSYAAYTIGSQFFEQICTDGTNVTFMSSPTGADSSFGGSTDLNYSTTLAALGNPDHIGFYVDGKSDTGQTYPGGITVFSFQATAGNTPQAAAAGGDAGADFLVTAAPNAGFPATNFEPTIAGDTPKFGLALVAGATDVADLTFPGSGESTITIPDSATLRSHIYLNYGEGYQYALDSLVGWPQDDGQGPNAPFWGHERSYALGDPNDLIPVTADGWKIMAHCAGPNYSNCSMNNVRSGFARLPTPFRPGMSGEMTYRPAYGYHNWIPWWGFTGQQLTPSPGTEAFAAGIAGPQNQAGWSGPNHELDFNDDFPRHDYGGCPNGGQVNFGTPNIYGTTWNTAPYMAYAANSGGWSNNGWGLGAAQNSTANVYECENGFVPGSVRTMFVNWRLDGFMDIFVNGKRVNSGYMEYNQPTTFTDPDGVTRTLGTMLLLGGQNVPTFDDSLSTVTDNDGVTSPNGDAGWTKTVYSYKVFNGNLANPNCCDAGVNAAATSFTTTAAAAADQAAIANGTMVWPGFPAMTASTGPVSATSGTPKIEQYRSGTLIATYSSFADGPSCYQVADSNGLFWVNPSASAASGCGPFTRSHSERMWAPGDTFLVYPAVYSGDNQQPYIGALYDNGNAYAGGSGTGSISGTTFTADAPTVGAYSPGGVLTGAAAGTTIVSGPPSGLAGTYVVSISQTLPAGTAFSEAPHNVNPDNITVQGVVQNGKRPVIVLGAGASDNNLGQAPVYCAAGTGGKWDSINITAVSGFVVGKAGFYNYGCSNYTTSNMRITGFNGGWMGLFGAGQYTGYWNMDRLELDHNGGTGQAHNAYIGSSAIDPTFTVRLTHSWSHDAELGHLFKCRAQHLIAIGNYFQGGLPVAGQPDAEVYDVDFPNGGTLDFEDNILTKSVSGPDTNSILLAIYMEGTNAVTGDVGYLTRPQNYKVANNTFVANSATFDGSHPLVPINILYPAVKPTDSAWAATGLTMLAENNLFIGFSPNVYVGNSAVFGGVSEIGPNFIATGAAHMNGYMDNTPTASTYAHPALIGPNRTAGTIGARD